jgi:hypothetical protein
MARSRLICRFLPDEYDAFVRLFPNDPEFSGTYEEWLEGYTKKCEKYVARGEIVNTTIIHHQHFLIYCQHIGIEPSDTTLNAFATKVLRENG